MRKRRIRSAIILAVGLAIVLVAPAPLSAASVSQTAAGGPGGVREADRAAVRTWVVDRLRGRRSGSGLAPANAAADGDALTILDAVDVGDPKGDIRKVLVGSGGGTSLLFTIQVEQYSDPMVDPTWLSGFTGGLWVLDTSGDANPELVINLFRGSSGLAAEVFDAESGAFVCFAVASTSSANKSYSATITQPGCLGDVKQPAVVGVFSYGPSRLDHVTDIAPNDDTLVRFNRPPPGLPAGGYAVATRGAGFQRFGALPPGATPAGTFDDFPGNRPVVATASSRAFDRPLWAVTDDGAVVSKDFANFWGDLFNIPLNQPIVGMAVLPDQQGYWLVARDGGIFAFGDAAFYGSTGGIRLNQPIVGMAGTPTGRGYWLVAADGGIFAYGDARFYGSTGSILLNKPVVGMAPGFQGQGYWLVASDGGIFAYGLPFYGSTGSVALQQPIVGMAPTRSGGGYRFIARDGGVFSYGDAEFHGSAAAPGRTDVIGLATA